MMNRFTNYLLGPELYWLILYVLVSLLIRITHSPVKFMDEFWIRISVLVPLVFLPLSFGVYWLSFVPKKWLLLRLIIAGVLGTHYVIEKGLNAYTNQGPGVGTSYMVGILLMLMVLFVLSIIALFKF
jgi:hypothetical protein